MSAAVDRVLDLLDAGLQSSGEASYGTDSAPGRCARCLTNEPCDDGDLCSPCRGFLLGDADVDPAGRSAPDFDADAMWSGLRSFTVAFSITVEEFATSLTRVMRDLAASPVWPILTKMSEDTRKRDERRKRHARWQARR